VLRGLVVVVGLVVVLGVVAELVVPGLVEDGIEETVRERTDDRAQVEAHATGTPFVPRLLLDGVVERVDVTLQEVAGRELTSSTVSMSAEGLQLDRRALLRGEVVLTGIDVGQVLLELDQDELVESLDLPVDIDPRALEIAGGALEFAGRQILDLAVPPGLLPCAPEVAVETPDIRLSCTFDELPDMFRGEAAR
jgi:hypothetical protein